jgi:hypothetical protein
MQPFCRAGDAAFAHNRAEDPQIRQVHSSLQKIILITIIHFIG